MEEVSGYGEIMLGEYARMRTYVYSGTKLRIQTQGLFGIRSTWHYSYEYRW